MPTNKTTQWREDFKDFTEDAPWCIRKGVNIDILGDKTGIEVDGRNEISDFFITKHLDTLELLEKEVEERMNNLKCTCPVGVVCDCGVERAYQALSDVLAIIRQHKEK